MGATVSKAGAGGSKMPMMHAVMPDCTVSLAVTGIRGPRIPYSSLPLSGRGPLSHADMWASMRSAATLNPMTGSAVQPTVQLLMAI